MSYVVLSPIILRIMLEKGGCVHIREIELELGLSRQEAYRRMRWLLTRGKVYRRDRGVYCLTERGKSYLASN